MKYGIDINNGRILKAISEGLKDRGNFIVDLTEHENIIIGKMLLKKVLIANVTNIDFYFAIEFKNSWFNCEIFYGEGSSSKIYSEKIMNLLNSRFKNIVCNDGQHLYLLKNTKAPVVYVKIPLQYEEKLEGSFLDELINILRSIEL